MLFSLVLAKRLIAAFSLHSFPFLPFVFCFWVATWNWGTGVLVLFSGAFIVIIIQRMIVFLPHWFGVNWIFMFVFFASFPRFFTVPGLCDPKRSSIIAVKYVRKEKEYIRIWNLNERSKSTFFVFGPPFSY